ncbi:MAG: hypothetical protein WC975_14130 [Phycisphaerae bacterium]
MSNSIRTSETQPIRRSNLVQRQFYALYEEDLPETVILNERKYRHVQTFKYDFFAGTGLYELSDPVGLFSQAVPLLIVVKIYRYRRFFGLPMSWLGIISVRHEGRLYQLLGDIPGVPRFEGFIGRTGFAHEYIFGRGLRRRDLLNDYFFDRLRDTLRAIHERGASYIDLHKMSNIILGDDQKPYLIDFQISYAPRNQWPIVRKISNIILRHFQNEDWYHYLKHKRRLRRDLLTQDDYEKSCEPSRINTMHKFMSKPYLRIRRFFLDLLHLETSE